jgi:hypothetical protein
MAFIGNQIITLNSLLDLDGQELVLDADADSTIHVSTDDQIDFKIGGTDVVTFTNSSSDFVITQAVQDKDIIFKGDDGGSAITALTLDMSEAGNASFNGTVTANAGVVVDNITIDGTEIDLSSGNLTIDVAGGIILDTDAGELQVHDGGTEYVQFKKDSNDVQMTAGVQDGDIVFRGNDGGSMISALTLDMSDAGHATFNNGITLSDGDLTVASGHGISFAATSDAGGMANELLDDYEEGTWTPFFGGSSGDPTVSSYATANGKYTKIGNMVYANFVCIASGTPSGGSGDLLIAGLPYAINATNTQPTGYTGIVNNITNNMSTSQLMLVGQSTSTNINVMNTSGTSTTGSNNLGVDKCHNSNARIDGTFIYSITA